MSGSTTSLSPSFHSQATQTPRVHNDHPMLTRAKTGNSKPKIFLTYTEPSTIKQGLSQAHWFEAKKVEYESLRNNDTWELITLPPN